MIETDRLILRPYAVSDFPAYLAMVSDTAVMRHLGGRPLPAEDAWNRLLRYAGHWALFGHGILAVFDRASGFYLGETGLADFHRGLGADFDGADEAAWVFTTAAHGRGMATEAAAAAHRWHDARHGRSRTVCIVDPANAGSIRLAGRLGYARFAERTYRGDPVLLFERLPPAILSPPPVSDGIARVAGADSATPPRRR